MADKIDVDVTGKSKYEIAHLIATNILTSENQGPIMKAGRKAYLRAVFEAVRTLSGDDSYTK